jgi:hypothetical protein
MCRYVVYINNPLRNGGVMSAKQKESKRIRLDSKSRVSLGKLIDPEITAFDVEERADGKLLLSPVVTLDIPAEEAWLYKSKQAFGRVKRGLEDAAEGKVKRNAVDFKKHVD